MCAMKTRKNLHSYQREALRFIDDKPKCLLMLDMGLGKTIISLTAISDLFDDFDIERVLIIAPLRVANTVWMQEAEAWAHTNHLTISICTGSEQERLAALKKDVRIHVINAENILWLVSKSKWKWDTVIIDESSKFKSRTSKRWKVLKKKSVKIKRMVQLTGTPIPNGYMDLWAQIFLLDGGKRLGKTITGFRQRFFDRNPYQRFSYELKPGADLQIKKAIADICITMKAEDYLEIKKPIIIKEFVELPEAIKAKYDLMKEEFVWSTNKAKPSKSDIEDNKDIIVAGTAAQVSNKLLQICNGAIYDEHGNTHEVHSLKIDVLKEIVEDNPGENILVAYNFKSDLVRLKKAFPKAVVLSRSGKELVDWNKGNIKMLLAHPASAGHGLNIQLGGSFIVWFGMTWSLELYKQFNARLQRQGQKNVVRIVHLLIKYGIDVRVMQICQEKDATQEDLMAYFKTVLKNEEWLN